jgi:hypothetical protein
MAASFDFFGNVPLNHVPFKDRIHFVREVRDILQHDRLISGLNGRAPAGIVPPQALSDVLGESTATDVSRVMDQLVMRGEEGRQFGTLPLSHRANSGFLESFWARANLQFRERPTIAGTGNHDMARGLSDYFTIGTSSYPMISPTSYTGPRSLSEVSGKSIMVMDIETAGLMKNATREVSYMSTTVDAAGGLSGQSTANSVFFSPRQFRRGTIGFSSDDGKTFSSLGTEEYAIKELGLGDAARNVPKTGLGEDYARRMMPVLNQMMSSDYIVGHNVASFDLPYIFSSLSQTSAYLDDAQKQLPGFRNLVNAAHSKFKAGSLNVIDTLEIARSSPGLMDLGVAPELAAKKSFSAYSIENILLMTDLNERLSPDLIDKIAKKGLHSADIDSEVTLSLLQNVETLNKRTTSISGAVLDDLKKSILKTSLITPTSYVPNVADNVLRTLIRTDRSSIFIPQNITTPEADELRSILGTQGELSTTQGTRAFNLIRGSAVDNVTFRINPIEHHILETRALGLGTDVDVTQRIDPTSWAYRAGMFDRVTGRGANYDTRSIRRRDYADMVRNGVEVPDAEWDLFRAELARPGVEMPWSGLDFEERRLGTAISGLTVPTGARYGEQKLGTLLSDSLTGIFETFDPLSIQYFTESGRMTLPAQMLKELGVLSEEDFVKPSFFEMSVVEPTLSSPDGSVNLVHKFQSQESVDKFVGELRTAIDDPNYASTAKLFGFNLAENGLLDEEQEKIVRTFRETMRDSTFLDSLARDGASKGVVVGQVRGKAGKSLIDVLKSINGLDRLTDEDSMRFLLPFMGMTVSPTTGVGSIYTSGVVNAHGISTKDLEVNIPKHIAIGRRHYDAMMKIADENPIALRLMKLVESSTTEEGLRLSEKLFNGYQSFTRTNLPRMVVAGVAATAGVLLYKKRKENEKYSESLQQMPTDDYSHYAVADELQMKKDSGYNGYRQIYDPLSTSFVVDNLNYNKIGHTNMGWDRNNNLYGGVL